jgi:hypothetical protein
MQRAKRKLQKFEGEVFFYNPLFIIFNHEITQISTRSRREREEWKIMEDRGGEIEGFYFYDNKNDTHY